MQVTKIARLDLGEVRQLIEIRYPFLAGRPYKITLRDQRYSSSEPPPHVEISWDEDEVEPWPAPAKGKP